MPISLPVNPRESVRTNIPRVTVSSIADLLACPRKFYETRIMRNWNQDSPNDNLERGKALHAVLRDLYNLRTDGTIPLDRLEVIVDRNVRRTNYSPDADKENERRRVMTMADAFVRSDDWEDIAGTIAVEKSIEYDLYSQGKALIKFSARLDRVLVRESDPQILVIRDYKSGAIKVDLAEVYVILRAAKHQWPSYREYVLELDGLSADDRIVRETVNYEECREMHDYFRTRAVEVLEAGYESNNWPACEGSCCVYCSLRESCLGLTPDEINNF